MEHFLVAPNEEEGTEVGPIRSGARRALEVTVADGNLRRLRNAIRRIVAVKRKGAISDGDVAEMVTPDASGSGGADVRVDDVASGSVLQVELVEGADFAETMLRVGRALTDAALVKHGGQVGAAMAALGMSKDVWYRVRKPSTGQA